MLKYRDCLQCQAFPEAAEGVNGCSQFHAVPLDQDSIQLIPRNLSAHLHLPAIVCMWKCPLSTALGIFIPSFFKLFFNLAGALSCLPLLKPGEYCSWGYNWILLTGMQLTAAIQPSVTCSCLRPNAPGLALLLMQWILVNPNSLEWKLNSPWLQNFVHLLLLSLPIKHVVIIKSVYLASLANIRTLAGTGIVRFSMKVESAIYGITLSLLRMLTWKTRRKCVHLHLPQTFRNGISTSLEWLLGEWTAAAWRPMRFGWF